jgi:hypothetical protein
MDFALTEENLRNKVKKYAKLQSGKKFAKQGWLTSSHRGFLLVILLGLASQIKIFGEAPPKSKAS